MFKASYICFMYYEKYTYTYVYMYMLSIINYVQRILIDLS